MSEYVGNRYLVIVGAIIVQLCLGSIYAWSFFQTALRESSGAYGWLSLWTQLPFAAGLASFALFMIFAGRWQDNVGPRKVATFGGALLGLGYILAWLVDIVAAGDALIGTIWLIITYGIIGGAGIGFAYVCPIAALVKWFPDKKGAITGIAVAGFGGGALAFGYVEQFLLDLYNVPSVGQIGMPFLILGVTYLILVVLGSQVLTNPPEGWLPPGYTPPVTTADGKGIEIMPGEMIRDRRFWLLWIMFVFAATAGLMTLGNVKTASILIDPLTNAVILVGIMSLLNAAGRIVWGAVSDKLGRENTMGMMFLVLALAMFAFAAVSTPGAVSWYAVMGIASLIGFCFGGNFALFPSATADFWGSKNVGKNYGVMFTAYGIAGILGGLVAGSFVDFTGSYFLAFVTTGVLAIVALVLVLVLKTVVKKNLISTTAVE
ncbi:MAG: OFA family MFS transporter [Candidatus Thorarchaeota archaeon]|nr:MAG: OFA family MFS transporter [Candidatus Thorarchaeota archaeon]